jgi:hypothetical protein
MKLIFIIILILLILFFYIHLRYNNNNYIIHPCDYFIHGNNSFHNKFEHSEKMLRSVGARDELIIKLKNIREKLGKNIVYAIKNKDNNYRIEIYLYSKNITESNYDKVDKSKFRKDINIILNEFNKEYDGNLDDVALVSFDLELTDSSFNNKLHIYEAKVGASNYNYTYDLDKKTSELESNFFRIMNYEELHKKLVNKEEFIKELKEISPNPANMMFHHKYHNNSIGIYLMENDNNILERFLDRYNYKIDFEKETSKDLIFDIGINYDLNENKIISTGFFDYF